MSRECKDVAYKRLLSEVATDGAKVAFAQAAAKRKKLVAEALAATDEQKEREEEERMARFVVESMQKVYPFEVDEELHPSVVAAIKWIIARTEKQACDAGTHAFDGALCSAYR